MHHLIWAYYAPGEVDRAVEHIDVLVERGASLEVAVEDAANIYRLRTGDFRTPYLRGHLATQWRVWRHGGPGWDSWSDPESGPGLPPKLPRYDGRSKPSKYPTEVSFRASFHRLFYE